jgi:hypothetical protein
MAGTLYMVIEHFSGGAEPVYRRFRERGRMAPDGSRTSAAGSMRR